MSDRRRLHLVHSTPQLSSKNSWKSPLPSAPCRCKPTTGPPDSPPLPPIWDTTSLAGKIQWCAFHHPLVLKVFEGMIDRMQAKAAANDREGHSAG
jgi:hypothetical protein